MALKLTLLHLFNFGLAVGWWRVAPGPRFTTWAVAMTLALAAIWTAIVITRRGVLTPRQGAGVVGIGTFLPWVWVLAVGAVQVVAALSITAAILGLVFVAITPLLAWAAFLTVHFGSRWTLQTLAAS